MGRPSGEPQLMTSAINYWLKQQQLSDLCQTVELHKGELLLVTFATSAAAQPKARPDQTARTMPTRDVVDSGSHTYSTYSSLDSLWNTLLL